MKHHEDNAVSERVLAPIPQQNSVPALVPRPGRKVSRAARPLVRLTRRSTQLLDRDNLWGSCKAILDSLQDAKLIPGDAEEDIDLDVTQEKVHTRKECGLYIELVYPEGIERTQ